MGRKGVFRRVCRWDGPQTPSRRCVPWGDASPALRRLRATSRTLNKSLLEPGQSLMGSGLTPGPQQVPGGRGDPGQREPWGSQGRGGGGACASLGRAWRAVGRRMAAASGRETDSSGQQDAGAWRTGPRPAPHLHLLSLVSRAWMSCLLAVHPDGRTSAGEGRLPAPPCLPALPGGQEAMGQALRLQPRHTGVPAASELGSAAGVGLGGSLTGGCSRFGDSSSEIRLSCSALRMRRGACSPVNGQPRRARMPLNWAQGRGGVQGEDASPT